MCMATSFVPCWPNLSARDEFRWQIIRGNFFSTGIVYRVRALIP